MQDRVNGTDLYRQWLDRLAGTSYNLGRVDSFLIQSIASAIHSMGAKALAVLSQRVAVQRPRRKRRARSNAKSLQIPCSNCLISRACRARSTRGQTPPERRSLSAACARSPDALAAARDKWIKNAPFRVHQIAATRNCLLQKDRFESTLDSCAKNRQHNLTLCLDHSSRYAQTKGEVIDVCKIADVGPRRKLCPFAAAAIHR